MIYDSAGRVITHDIPLPRVLPKIELVQRRGDVLRAQKAEAEARAERAKSMSTFLKKAKEGLEDSGF